MSRYRIKDRELWVLIELYVAPCGLVAHWLSHSGAHEFEPVQHALQSSRIGTERTETHVPAPEPHPDT